MPGLVWRCEFTSLNVKEEDLVHEVFTIAVAHLADISATKENKEGSWKDKVEQRKIKTSAASYFRTQCLQFSV